MWVVYHMGCEARFGTGAEKPVLAAKWQNGALGHEIRNAVEKAYARTDLLERRRQLMENWSRYLNI